MFFFEFMVYQNNLSTYQVKGNVCLHSAFPSLLNYEITLRKLLLFRTFMSVAFSVLKHIFVAFFFFQKA